MIQSNQLLNQYLEHIGNTLNNTIRTYTIRTQTALEKGTDLTLKIYIEQCQNCIQQQQHHAYQYKFNK